MEENTQGMTCREWHLSHNINKIMKDLEIEQNDDNIDTPRRIAKMYCNELFKNVNKSTLELEKRMTTFSNPQSSQRPITVKGIKFHSMCEHHWLPFFGECDIEYVPQSKILGLSKFPRVVEWFCKKPQVQERLTDEIGAFLCTTLNPLWLKVTMRDVTHTCVLVRGIEAECTTDTVFEFGERRN